MGVTETTTRIVVRHAIAIAAVPCKGNQRGVEQNVWKIRHLEIVFKLGIHCINVYNRTP